jgi:hypothetical protein
MRSKSGSGGLAVAVSTTAMSCLIVSRLFVS